jgi:mRNA interferase MazF
MARGLIRGGVYLCPFPSPDKERPVVVVTRTLSLKSLNKVTVAPITRTRRGVAGEVLIDEADGMREPCAVNLHNLITVPSHALGKRLTTLSPRQMNAICRALRFALECDCPS